MSIKNKIKDRRFTATITIMFLSLFAFAISAPVEAGQGLGSKGGTLIICDKPLPTAEEYEAMDAARAARGGAGAAIVLPAPLEDTFLLHSNPGSDQILFMDFDGFKGYKVWSMDGDTSTFNDEERTVIQATWLAVAEDFYPFNIDVTTEAPPSGWLGQRAVIDGSARYDYSFAYIGDWASTRDREAYIFYGDHTWEWISQSVSHEVGHTLDLNHHGSTDDGGYYLGHGVSETDWCPLMGWGTWSLNNWSDGQYFEATNPGQDDLATITNVLGVDYRADDHGDGIGSATPITLSSTSLDFSASGFIEQTNDVDYFSFTTSSSGNVKFSINEYEEVGITNLDVLAQIHDDTGAVIHTSNPIDLLDASFDVTLAAGDYYLSIDGVGWGTPLADPATGYSDYAILGFYSVLALAGGGAESDPPTPNAATFASPPASISSRDISMTATTGSDASGVVEYLFIETSHNASGSNSAWQSSPTFIDGSLDLGVEYSYTVSMRDAYGNIGGASAPASATVGGGGCTPSDMHIESVVCAEINCGQGKKNGQVTVTILNDCGDPVENALVDITFSGDYSESFSDVATDANGQAVVTTAGCVKKPGFTVTVDDVTGALPYDSNDNVTDSCSG